jgi:hypothetical protein
VRTEGGRGEMGEGGLGREILSFADPVAPSSWWCSPRPAVRRSVVLVVPSAGASSSSAAGGVWSAMKKHQNINKIVKLLVFAWLGLANTKRQNVIMMSVLFSSYFCTMHS